MLFDHLEVLAKIQKRISSNKDNPVHLQNLSIFNERRAIIPKVVNMGESHFKLNLKQPQYRVDQIE